jgi:hypothetical protein
MKSLMSLALIVFALLPLSISKAATIEVYGKKYYNNCAYFSSINSEIVFIYNNPEINARSRNDPHRELALDPEA